MEGDKLPESPTPFLDMHEGEIGHGDPALQEIIHSTEAPIVEPIFILTEAQRNKFANLLFAWIATLTSPPGAMKG